MQGDLDDPWQPPTQGAPLASAPSPARQSGRRPGGASIVALVACGALAVAGVGAAGWFASAHDLLGALGRAGTTSGRVCGVSGGPPWLFDVMLAAGGIALIYGVLWIGMLFSQGDPVQSTRRSRWSWLGLAGFLPMAVQLVVVPGRTAVLIAAGALVFAPGLATLVVMGRRTVATGLVPPARSAPHGMFWVMVAVSVAGGLLSGAALVAQFALGHTVAC